MLVGQLEREQSGNADDDQAKERRLLGILERSYLGAFKHGAKAVEELVWRDDSALHQAAGEQSGGCPPSRADGHFPKPLL